MMSTKTIVGTLLALGLTLYPGYYHGVKYFRWGQNEKVTQMAARLAEFPQQFRGWKLVSEHPLESAASDMLQPIEYISRRYARGDSLVQLFVLLGPTGPTAVHTPDICFSTQNYSQVGERQRVAVDPGSDGTGECWVSDFRNKNFGEDYVKSWYAWTTDGKWHASDDPRYFFAKSPYLLKIQIEGLFPDQAAAENCPEAEQFIKEVQKYLTDQIVF